LDLATDAPFKGTLELLPVGVLVVGVDGRTLYSNPAAASCLGCELPRGAPLESWLEQGLYVLGTDRPYPRSSLPTFRAFTGETSRVDDVELRRNGPTPAVAPHRRLSVWAAPLRDFAGASGSSITTFTDITQQHRELHEAQKLAAIGQLTAGVAHEINTPMQYIGDNTRFLDVTVRRLLELADSFERLLQSCRSGGPKVADLDRHEQEISKSRLPFLRQQAPLAIEQSASGIDQVRAIVQALKEFSHPGSDELVPMDLNHLVRTATTITRNAWRYLAQLELELNLDLPPALGNPQAFGQVLINLIVNAADAIEAYAPGAPEGHVAKIVVRSRAIDGLIELQVEDTGGGIPAAIQKRVMDPFFTTKGIGKGTGQGLPLAYATIVNQHAGKFFFETRVGRGTTFFIQVPQHFDEQPAPRPQLDPAPARQLQHEKLPPSDP
jgi:signal transduction histidine kinase